MAAVFARRFAIVLLAACGTSSVAGPTTTIDASTHDAIADAIDESGDEVDDAGTLVFEDSGPFVPQPPNPSLTDDHVTATGKPHTGTDCMPCHSEGSSYPAAPVFAFAGTVYFDTGKGAPGVEVRVIDGAGATSIVYTDEDGNFWRFGGTGTIVWPAHTGVRDAIDSPSMDGSFSDGGCNRASCHDGSSAAPRIVLLSSP